MSSFSPDFQQTDFELLSPASHWIAAKFVKLQKSLDQQFEIYEFGRCVDALYDFLWNDFASVYVEYLKSQPQDLEFAKILFREFIILLSPFCPFLCEVLWLEFFGEKSLLAEFEY